LSYQTTIALTAGAHYLLYVEARNSVGYSAASEQVSIHAVQVPDKPAAPVTSVIEPNVIITWAEPYNGGSSITSYSIGIQTALGNFVEDDLCEGASLVTDRSCSIPTSHFTEEPYSLAWGSSIFA
jgi:hypothetical protein